MPSRSSFSSINLQKTWNGGRAVSTVKRKEHAEKRNNTSVRKRFMK